jgi:hypothetical protein
LVERNFIADGPDRLLVADIPVVWRQSGSITRAHPYFERGLTKVVILGNHKLHLPATNPGFQHPAGVLL